MSRKRNQPQPPPGYAAVPQPPEKRRRHRPFTWFILLVNLAFLAWVIAGAASGSGNATNCGSLSQHTCNEVSHAGTAIGVGLIIVFWAIVDVILGILWLVTRRREPTVVYMQQPPGQQPPPQ